MKSIFKIAGYCLFLSLLFCCKKKPIENKIMSNKNYVLDDNVNSLLKIEQLTNEIEFMGRGIPDNNGTFPNTGSFLNCSTIKRSNPYGDHTQLIEINFNSGVKCTDGKTRSGKVAIIYNQLDKSTFISANNYAVNGVMITGTYTLDYLETDVFKRKASLIIPAGTLQDGQTTTDFNLSKKSTITAGYANADLLDDQIEYSDAKYFMTVNFAGKSSLVKASTIINPSLDYKCDNYLPNTGRLKVEYINSGTNGNPNTSLSGTLFLTFAKVNCSDKIFTETN